jgi:hypothetical protein
MALMDAKEYDPQPARKRLITIAIAAVLVITFMTLWFWPSGRFRFRREWNIANDFLTAIERHDFDSAYGLYNADPKWKHHSDNYNSYSLSQFTLDWGASSEFGVINSHKIICAIEPPQKGAQSASGIVISVTVNRHSDPTLLWIEKKSGSISTSPLTFEELVRHAPLVNAVCNRL